MERGPFQNLIENADGYQLGQQVRVQRSDGSIEDNWFIRAFKKKEGEVWVVVASPDGAMAKEVTTAWLNALQNNSVLVVREKPKLDAEIARSDIKNIVISLNGASFTAQEAQQVAQKIHQMIADYNCHFEQGVANALDRITTLTSANIVVEGVKKMVFLTLNNKTYGLGMVEITPKIP